MDEIPKIEGFVFKQRLTRSMRGEIWRAEQTALERDVLVQVFGSEVRSDQALCDALFEIVRATAQLKSQLFPDVIDVIRTQNQAYVILEDAHAQGILPLLAGRRLNAEQVTYIATRLAEGFNALHAAHLVYANLKPSNLYLSEDSEPVLPDLSLVQFEPAYGKNPPQDSLAGSPPYVAPEQYTVPETVDTRADMFAMGMTLYALATGQIPFGSRTPEAILEAKLTESVASPCDISPHFPPALAMVLSKLCQREPSARYADWDEVLFDLHLASTGGMPECSPNDSVIAPPNPNVQAKAGRTIRLKSSDLRQAQPPSFRPKRRPLLLFVVSGLALLLLIILLGFCVL
ncbi:MAG: serine/threonine-protein kinase [Kiritimatiellia bacterium]